MLRGLPGRAKRGGHEVHGSAGQVQANADVLQVRNRRGLAGVTGCSQGLKVLSDVFCLVFGRYYSGEKKAPVLTIFIGGNHEASNHLQELPYGGWVAPNIYYLGKSLCIYFTAAFE